MRNRTKANDKGMALVIALVMLLTLTIMGIAAITTTTVEIQIAGNERFSLQAMNLADAGVERALLDLSADYKENGDWSDAGLLTYSTGFENTLTLPNKFTTFPDDKDEEPGSAEWGDPFSVNLASGGIVGNAVAPYGRQTLGSDGHYTVLLLRDSARSDEIWARVYALHPSGSRKIIQLHLLMSKVDSWHNAVFAGMGSATSSIQGNIKINGPVHLLGQGDTNEWTIKGNAEVTNGYKDLGKGSWDENELFNRLPTPEIAEYLPDGTTPVYSLGSVLRVKNAQVGIEGAANIGEAGGGSGVPDGVVKYGERYYKSTLDGVYSNTTIEGTNLEAKIHADEIQMPAGYDLGDKVQMPTFEDDYQGQLDRGDPPQPCDDCETYLDYILEKSINIDGATYPERCTLKSGTPGDSGVTNAFAVGSWDCPGIGVVNSTTPSATIQDDVADVALCTCNESTGCLLWKPSAGTYPSPVSTEMSNLRVEGRVEFDGCAGGLKMGTDGTSGGGGADIVYEGAGIIYSPSPVTIDGSLVTKAKNPDGSVRTFTNIADEDEDGKSDGDLLGILTPGSMAIAPENSQETFMGAFFSSETIGIRSTGNIIGTVVSNRYCMGKSVNLTTNLCGNESGNPPDIHYVDQLAGSIVKLGMIQSKVVFTFEEYNWQEVY